MRRMPMAGTVLATLTLAGAAGVLAVSVLQAVNVPPVGEAPAEAAAGEAADRSSARGDRPEPAQAAADTEPGENGGDGVRALLARGEAPGEPGRAARDGESAPAAWEDLLSLAVDNDPFSPRRRPPARRYQLPSEREPVVREAPRERPEAPDFRIVGTALTGPSGLALVHSGDAEPRVMTLGESVEGVTRVEGEAGSGGTGLALVQVDRGELRVVGLGESVMGYTLAAVDGESATLVGPAGTLRYPVTEPLVRRDDDDDRRRRRGRDDDDDERARELRIQMERVRSIQQRLQRGGAINLGGGRIVIPRRGGGSGDTPPPPVWIPSRPGGGGTPPVVPGP